MNDHFQWFPVLAVITILLFSNAALAEEPVQLALFNPYQLLSEDESIRGVRLNLIYGKNDSLTGGDFGLFNHLTAPSIGVQWGVVGFCESDFSGAQANFVCVVKGSFLGFQSGGFNYSGNATGLQFGFVNYTERMEGVQLGFVNYAESMNGIQIGLVNIILQGSKYPVFPLVNWVF